MNQKFRGPCHLTSSTQIYMKFISNPTIIVICLFIQIFSLFAYITYLNALMDMKYYKVNIFQLCKMFLNVVFTIIKFCIEFGLNPALTVICLFIQIFSLFTYITYLLIWRQNIVKSICIKLWKMLLSVIFILIKC